MVAFSTTFCCSGFERSLKERHAEGPHFFCFNEALEIVLLDLGSFFRRFDGQGESETVILFELGKLVLDSSVFLLEPEQDNLLFEMLGLNLVACSDI